MRIPSLPQLVLLFFLGGQFIHFFLAGARTFYYRAGDAGPAAVVSQGAFLFGGVIPTWSLGLYQPIPLANGILAACVLIVSTGLYEWARATIWGRRFGLGWGDHVPEELCESGPYRYIRHPLYLSYVLAFIATLVALPHWITALMAIANIVLWTLAAQSDERRIAQSPLAGQYAQYRRRVGMLLPRLRWPYSTSA
jgi:protein-S-isoprenylcysteine O-methyltransferase Ste14